MVSKFKKALKSYKHLEIIEIRSFLLFKNILISGLLRLTTIFISFFLVAKSLKLVGSSDYGLWLTLISIVNLLNLFDLGFGNGLKNRLAEAHSSFKYKLGKIYISTTYGVIITFSILISSLFGVLNLYVDWSFLFKLTNYSHQFINSLVLITVSFFCLTFILQVVNAILIALHLSYFILLIEFIANLCSLIIINIFEDEISGSISSLVLTLVGVPIIIKTLASVFLFNTSLKSYKPNFKFIRINFINRLFSLGGVFFLLQIGAIILFQTDNVLIAYLFGVDAVVTYNLVFKLFSILIGLTGIVMTPLWSSFTDAYVKKDFEWIRRIFNKILVFWLLGILGSIMLLIISPIILRFWLGNSFVFSWCLSFSICVYVLLHCLMVIVCTLLNGIGKVKLQLLLYFFIIIFNLPLSILLSKYLGVAGIVASNSICLGVASLILLIQTSKIINQTAKGIWIL